MAERSDKDISALLQTLDADALKAVKVPSQEEIKSALDRSRARLRQAMSSPRPAPAQTRVRYK